MNATCILFANPAMVIAATCLSRPADHAQPASNSSTQPETVVEPPPAPRLTPEPSSGLAQGHQHSAVDNGAGVGPCPLAPPAVCTDFNGVTGMAMRPAQERPGLQWDIRVGRRTQDVAPSPIVMKSGCGEIGNEPVADLDLMTMLCGNHMVAAMGDKGARFITLRERASFDFAGRTGTIAFTVDLKFTARQWLGLWITPDRLRYPGDPPDVHGDPANDMNCARTKDGTYRTDEQAERRRGDRGWDTIRWDTIGYDGPVQPVTVAGTNQALALRAPSSSGVGAATVGFRSKWTSRTSLGAGDQDGLGFTIHRVDLEVPRAGA